MSSASRFFLLLLLLIFGAATLIPASVSESDARLLWIVRDVETVRLSSGVREAARTALNNLGTAWSRARGDSALPIHPMLLDGWTWLVGDYAEMARLFSIFCAMIAVAALLRLTAMIAVQSSVVQWERWLRWQRWIGLLIVLPPLFLAARQLGAVATLLMGVSLVGYAVARRSRTSQNRSGTALLTLAMLIAIISFQRALLLQTAPDWEGAVQEYRQARDPLHPAITAFAPDSPLGYYDYRYNLRQGVTLDLAWRTFTEAEVTRAVRNLTRGDTPVWLVMPQGDSITPQVITALTARGYTADAESIESTGGFVFQQYVP